MDEPDYTRLREGICPKHGTPLARRDGHGWCDDCSTGWSMTPNSVSLHLELVSTSIDGRELGPGIARLTFPPPRNACESRKGRE